MFNYTDGSVNVQFTCTIWSEISKTDTNDSVQGIQEKKIEPKDRIDFGIIPCGKRSSALYHDSGSCLLESDPYFKLLLLIHSVMENIFGL